LRGTHARSLRRAFASTRFCRPSFESWRWYTCGGTEEWRGCNVSAARSEGSGIAAAAGVPSLRWCRW
jgi:hypothetical protein